MIMKKRKNKEARREVKFVGITRKTEPMSRAVESSRVSAFIVEFNSVNETFEQDFLESLECFKKHGTSLNVTEVREHRYKMFLDGSDGNVFGILFRMYLSYRNNLWMEIDTDVRFEPLLDFVVELKAA